MENLLNELLVKAKEHKPTMKQLKHIAVTCGNYELASKLREIELECFPETKEEIQAKEDAEKLNLVFRMVDLDVPEETCHKISQTIKKYSELKGEFSIKDASKIISETKKYFGE